MKRRRKGHTSPLFWRKLAQKVAEVAGEVVITARRTKCHHRQFNIERLNESLHHHFQYLMGACTDVGFFLIEGLTYKSQSLFVIARIFNDLGGPPAVVQGDGAGELITPAALKFFTSKGTRRDAATAGQH